MLGVDVTACELRAGGELATTIHVVWSPLAGPVAAFWTDDLALTHALERGSMRVTECQLRAQLPLEIRDDVYVAELEDFDDDETPVDDLPPVPALKRR